LPKYPVIVFLWGLLIAGSCQQPEKAVPNTLGNRYFDVPGFIRSQVALLQAQKPVAIKRVQESEASTETKTIQNPNWNKELATFAELDLNRPAFRNAYNITRQTDSAGLVSEIYRKKAGNEGDIQLLVVTFDSQKQVKAIRAVRESNNILISTHQEMQLLCTTASGTTRISSFGISGRQKPIVFDTLRYAIVTKIK
jgi:hypothetical protein